MPSVSKAQARLMAAVAHGWKKPGGGGPPVAVAKEFNKADEGRGCFGNDCAKHHKSIVGK